MAFYQKYRAKKFGEMIGQAHVTGTLLESIKSGKTVHAYLFTGPRGIGKTSIARLLAKAINCLQVLDDQKNKKPVSGEPCNECLACKAINEGKAIDVIEIDAASHTGVDEIRELIEKSRLLPTDLAKKVYIIDEVHMLSKSAFNALLKTLEEPPAHVVFILATTEIHKIPATILSRAQRFDLKRAQKEEIIKNLKRVAEAEEITIDDESLDLIAISAAGGHRDALGLLEQVASAGHQITAKTTKDILGIAETEEVFKFIGAIFNNRPEEGLKIARELFEKGTDLSEFNRSVIDKLRVILLCRYSEEIFVEDTKENIERLKKMADSQSPERILHLINLFMETGNLLKDVAYPLLPIEMAVIKASDRETERQSDRVTERQRDGETDQKPICVNTEKNIPIATGTDDEPAKQPRNEESSATPSLNHSVTHSVPVPVLEMTKDIWEQIIENTKKANGTLAALLRDARPEEFTKDLLKLGVKFKFHKDRISETKHTQILEKVVEEVIGSKCKIVCEISDGKPKIRKPAQKENLEQAAAEVFEIE